MDYTVKALEGFNEYIEALKTMDWYYEFSDDFKVWESGKNKLIALRKEAERLDKNFIHWNYYCANDNLKYKGD